MFRIYREFPLLIGCTTGGDPIDSSPFESVADEFNLALGYICSGPLRD